MQLFIFKTGSEFVVSGVLYFCIMPMPYVVLVGN